MNNDWMNLDLASMAKSLKENIRSFGGFSPEEVRRSGLQNEEGLRFAILKTLKDSSKTGHEVIEAIVAADANSVKVTAGSVYPLLESLVDESLLTWTMKKDRRVFSITAEGKKHLASAPKPDEMSDSQKDSWAPKWVDVRGVVPVAASRLAKVSLEVSQYGTKEQQEAAAKAIDEARQQIHLILAKG